MAERILMAKSSW